MSKIIVANWKMFPSTLHEAEDLYRVSAGAIVCPPFVYLEELSKIKSGAVLGAQDIALSSESSQTGEVSGEMLVQFGVKYVIIGHSERRQEMGETDEMINKKLKAALINGLVPVLAVGEKNKSDNREEILKSQLSADLNGVDSSSVVIAYEPVWAIGTGDAETPGHAAEAVQIIKGIAGDIPVLYGGSVDSKNISDFVSRPEIVGVLVGKASTDKEEIKKIIEISSNA